MSKSYDKIKKCFWIFFFFLLTEGIFRRWLLPEFNNMFLVIRDPFVIYAVVLGMRCGLFRSGVAKFIMGIGILCFIFALTIGHGNLLVAIYGARITVFYFPFIYIVSRVLSRDDVLKIGKVLVLMIIPMVFLNIVQFFSPQSSFVNIGVGGDEDGAGFGGAMGYFRPPGIFTFIAGLTDYYACSLGFLLYFYFCPEDAARMKLSRWLIILSVCAYFISIPVSISRTHFVQTGFILVFFVIMAIRSGKSFSRVIMFALFVVIAIPLLFLNNDTKLFIDVFMERFTGANESEGGLAKSAMERIFGWLFRAIDKVPLFGFGDGYFSNVGMKILHGDTNAYTGAIKNVVDSTEMEWGRIVCEDGVILGILLIVARIKIAYNVWRQSLNALCRRCDYLSWLLMPMAAFSVCIYQCKAPYNLGFMTLMIISVLVSLRTNNQQVISN